MSDADWDAVLDDFAARLSQQREALEADESDLAPAFVPPACAVPLPSRLRSRAEHLHDQALGLEREIEARLASTARDLQVVRRLADATSETAGASYVDRAL